MEMKNNMKDYIQFETRIGLNSGSYRTSIPKEIAEYFEINKDEKLKWRLNIKTNTITLIPPSEKPENTSADIDETTIKTEKKDTSTIQIKTIPENTTSETKSTITDPNIKSNPIEYYEKLKNNHQHTSTDTEEKFLMSIQKSSRKNNHNNFKIEFKDYNNRNNSITRITIGTLKDTIETLHKLETYDSEKLKEYLLSNSKDPKKVEDKIKNMKS